MNNIVHFRPEEVSKICLALKLNPRKVIHGRLVYYDRIKMMYLRAFNYFKLHNIQKTSDNIANYLVWKYTKVKQDKRIHQIAMKTFIVITRNIYRCKKTKDLNLVVETDVCECTTEERCKDSKICINRYKNRKLLSLKVLIAAIHF